MNGAHESSRRLSGIASTIGETVTPHNSTEIGAVLAEATANNRTVMPFGGGVSLVTGHPVERFDTALDMARLSGIISWEPADMVISVRAGTSFAEVRDTLAEKSQEVPVDIAYPERATIGGIVATGFAGPRRLRSGSLRDLLIGCEYVRGDGLVAHAGGMVVKNVSGFEIPRFLHGSWGALAVVTSVNLKVIPKPRGEGTRLTTVESPAAAVEMALGLLRAIPTIDACTIDVRDGVTTLAIRVLGRDRTVTEAVAAMADATGIGETITGTDSASWWQRHVDRYGETEGGTLIAFGFRPRHTLTVVQEIVRVADDTPSLTMAIDPGIGSLRIRLSPSQTSAHAALDAAVAAGAGYVVERTSTPLDGIDPWGSTPDAIAIMRELKQQFDPGAVLNRGRLMVS